MWPPGWNSTSTKQSRDYYIHEGYVVELLMECSFIFLPCLMGSSRVVPLDAAAKSRGVQESRLVRICGGIITTTTRINSSSSSLTFSSEKFFYNFDLSCIFIITLLVFFWVGILQKRWRETTAWNYQCCGEFTWRLERDREKELAGHEWALDLVNYLLTLVELAIACVKFSLYKKIGIFFGSKFLNNCSWQLCRMGEPANNSVGINRAMTPSQKNLQLALSRVVSR